MYLLKKDNFEFENILSENYIFDEQPVVLKKSTMANGNIRIIYADHTSLKIKIKFGRLDGATIKSYDEKLVDGEYSYWDSNTRTHKAANFIVSKDAKSMITSKNNEMYNDFEVILEKSSEVASSL